MTTSRTTIEPEDLGTILSIWAHPDDETYLSGGTMAAARDNGQRVVCVSATAGERGTPDPTVWPPDRLGPVRRWEAAAAMAVLGVDEHRVHDLPDGSLADRGVDGVAWVAGLIDEIRPDTILTFGVDGMTHHPDHVAVHRWVTCARSAVRCRARLLWAAATVERLEHFRDLHEAWGVYMGTERPSGVPVADLELHVRLDGRRLDRKLTALRAMATQTSELVDFLDVEVYRAYIADEGFVEADPRA